MGSVVLLSLSSPKVYPEKSAAFQLMETINMAVNIVFSIEMFIRIIAHGFYFGEHAYLASVRSPDASSA